MKRFHNAREARDFIASQISDEAVRENITLTDNERKWLNFTEAKHVGSATDYFENEENDADDLYEEKIAQLIRSAVKRARRDSPEEYAAWWGAIGILKKKDLFLNVLIRRSGVRPPGDILKLLGTALLVVVIPMCCIILMDKFGIDLPPRRTLVFYVWITVAVLAVAGTIDWYASGGKTVDTIISKVFFRQSEREK